MSPLRKALLTSFAFVVLFLGSAAKASADPVVWAGNGNNYLFVTFTPGSPLTWQQARDAAASMTFMGVQGHLVTITSAGENAFINTSFNTGMNANFAWIGGHEPNDNGVWRWAVGPESGIQFSLFKVPTPPFLYANWGGVEPNDNKANEDFLMFNIGTTLGGIAPGQWADAAPNPSSFDPVIGYVVEFETGASAVPEPAAIVLLGTGLAGVLARIGRKRRQREPVLEP